MFVKDLNHRKDCGTLRAQRIHSQLDLIHRFREVLRELVLWGIPWHGDGKVHRDPGCVFMMVDEDHEKGKEDGPDQ